MLKLPFVMYADFESILKPEDGEEGGADEPWTVKTQRHIADGFAVYVKCDDQRFYEKPHVYTGGKCGGGIY